jgi:hypothetical protein
MFIFKTLFPQKLCDASFTNPTSMVGVQLLNFRLLKIMVRCVNDGVITIERGHQTSGNVPDRSDESIVFHAVPYVRKNIRLENTQGSLQSGMPGSNSETRGRFCDGLGSKFAVLCILLAPLLSFMSELLEGSTWRGWVIRRVQ